jgi:hypothetical protein
MINTGPTDYVFARVLDFPQIRRMAPWRDDVGGA